MHSITLFLWAFGLVVDVLFWTRDFDDFFFFGLFSWSIFHHHDAKKPLLIDMESIFLAFESFPIVTLIGWVALNVSASSSCFWHESSFKNASSSVFLNTYGLSLRSLSSTSNLPFLKLWNYLLLWQASSSYDSTSNRCRFLEINEVI